MSNQVPPDHQLRYHHVTPMSEEPLNRNPFVMRLVWIIVGFNVGFILPLMLTFGVLPLVAPDFAPRQAESEELSTTPLSLTEVAYVVVTGIPTATPILPTPTLTPTVVAPTEAALAPTEETANSLPSATPFPTATPIPPTPTPIPAPVSYQLSGIKFHRQGWNNCGPANLAMGLSFYGWTGDQTDTASFLKPEREDRNVSPDQMIAYVNENTDLRAIHRVAGNIDMLRWLVSNNFLVIVEKGYQPPGEDWYGHYLTFVGYDINLNELHFYDSNLGTASSPMFIESPEEFDRNWQAFNRTYLVIYPPEREVELQTFLGRDWNEMANWRYAAELAKTEAAAEPDNAFAWFNVGTALTNTGEYQTAGRAFDQAFNIGLPWRMMWYQFEPYEAYFQSSRLEDVVALAQATIKTTPYVEEAYYFIGRVYEIQGNTDDAIQQYETALRYNRNFRAAQEAANRLGA